MKTYWEIQGPNKAPQQPCIVFNKYDGSNFRAEWSKKRGWYKFGTRHRMIAPGDEQWSHAIELFMKTYSEDLNKTFRDNKDLRKSSDIFTVFCEYFGPNSFAGWHDPSDKDRELMLFDVNVHKKGIMLPRDFIKHFKHLKIAEVVWEGNFSKQFVQDVKDGKIVTGEGVVAKGVNQKKGKSAQHGLWMAKCKTKWWMDELTKRVGENPEIYKKVFEDNKKEQG